MKLIKQANGIYHAQFRTADGKVKSITTRTTNKDDAVAVAKESGIAELEMAAKAGRLTNEAIGHIVTGKKLTMSKALEAYAKWLATVNRSPRTVANNVGTVASWIKAAGVATLSPTAVSSEHINDWINDEDSATKSGTRKFMLAGIRSFFNFCSAKGWCVGDPSRLVGVNMGMLDHSQKEKVERQPMTEHEYKMLLNATAEGGIKENQFWHLAIRASWEVGLRLGDICQLEWQCFSRPHKIIVWTDKRDTRVALPISDGLSDLVSEIPVTHNLYLFREQREIILDTSRRSRLSVQFGRLAEACGVHGKSFHCLRHAFATRLKKEGLTMDDIAEAMGHTGTKATEGYVHED